MAVASVCALTRHLLNMPANKTIVIKKSFHLASTVFGTSVNIKPTEDGTYVQLESTSKSLPLLLHSTWLRDHCRCPQCFNKTTKHKLVEIGTIDSHSLRQVKLENEELLITWPDGHQSSYNVDWLWDNVYDGYKEIRKSKKKLWNSGFIGFQVLEEPVNYDDYMNSDQALTQVLSSIVNYGFAVLQKGPATPDGAVKAAERIGPLRLGFFGEVMKFNNSMLQHKHSEFANKLVPHTDQSYLTEPAGLKIMNCLSTGGSAFMSFVDGFSAAEELKTRNPLAYETLSKVPIPFEFKSDAAEYRTKATLFQHDVFTKELLLVRYNMYYRSALSPEQRDDMDRFYTALHAYSKLVQAHTRAVRLTPLSGTVYLVDNWRILSHMGQYKERGVEMAGCYLGFSDYMSLARRLGVIKTPKTF